MPILLFGDFDWDFTGVATPLRMRWDCTETQNAEKCTSRSQSCQSVRAAWQIARSLRCLLTKLTWWKNYNYNWVYYEIVATISWIIEINWPWSRVQFVEDSVLPSTAQGCRNESAANRVWRARVVNGQTSSAPNPARTRKLIWSPNHARKNPKVKLGQKNLAMLPSYFDCIFVHLKQKARLRPELSPKFLSTLGSIPARTRPEYVISLLCCDNSPIDFVFCSSSSRANVWTNQNPLFWRLCLWSTKHCELPDHDEESAIQASWQERLPYTAF